MTRQPVPATPNPTFTRRANKYFVAAHSSERHNRNEKQNNMIKPFNNGFECP